LSPEIGNQTNVEGIHFNRTAVLKKQQNPRAKKSITATTGGKYTTYIYLAVVLIITIIAYSNSLSGDFIYQFDDDLYVTNNPDIKEVTRENLYNIFTQPYVGLYLPLTMLSLMADYAIYGLDASGFHLTNLLMHLINTVLVFFLLLTILPH